MKIIRFERIKGIAGIDRKAAIAAAAAAVLMLTACGSMSERERGTAQGAGAGALAGAVIGSVTGGSAGSGAVLGGAVGAVAGNLWSKHLEDKRQALSRATAGTGVAVERTPDDRLKVNVPSDVSFDTGRADIKPEMRPILNELGRSLDAGVRLTVVGHTDNTGSDAINEPLSRERALAVRDYLSARGVPADRVGVQGRGSREPVADNDSDRGRSANRRVEIFLSQPASG
jgi:outer membrane protein OmpA-like peptidoglycan-associated protein